MSVENDAFAAQELEKILELLHEKAPDSIGDLLRLRVGQCDPQAGVYTLYARVEPWMCNPYGTLHGGIISTMMDQAMGVLAIWMTGAKAHTPTVQLNLTFHHPLLPSQRTVLRVHTDAITRTMLHLRAEAYNEQEPQRLCASATGIFYIRGGSG